MQLKSRKMSEDDRCSDMIAFEITKDVRRRRCSDMIAFEITKDVRRRIDVRTRLPLKSRKMSEDDRCSDMITFEITKDVRRQPMFGHDCR
ncbi:hypothetical protein [Bacillus sp. X1(2014)]|uniref:hypothetical protein n=1 Tax=Bacillus sp. X1(2014) TaxID=1565991 RepID=UPI0011A68F43|nr:hypothetical protein [Bacillus sp. X1(2014)]